jgi:hypothetical protein
VQAERPWYQHSGWSALVSDCSLGWGQATCLVDELIFNLHFFAKLPPYLSESQFIVGMDESIQPNNVKLILLFLRQIGNNGLNQL